MEILLHVSDKMIGKIDLLMERVPYLAEEITAVDYDIQSSIIRVILDHEDSSKRQELELHYNELCASLAQTRVIGKTVVRNNLNDDTVEHHAEPVPSLPAAPYLDETDIVLLEQLDRAFIDIARRHGAELREYPSTFGKSNMVRNQYHINFPQNIIGTATVPHNYKHINEFRQQALSHSHHQSLVPTGEILQPCICYHCYEEHQGSRSSQRRVLTAKGRCFRNEISWRKDAFRRTEFTMREIVFVGDQQWVAETRDNIMHDVWALFDRIGLHGKIETATDPFFFSQDVKTKGTYQMVSNAKYELAAVRTTGQESSIASFNYCEDVLCGKYDIADEQGEQLYSGCVAFGTDRWKEAFLDRHGRDRSLWPSFDEQTGVAVQKGQSQSATPVQQSVLKHDAEQTVVDILNEIFEGKLEVGREDDLNKAGLDSITTIDLIVGLENKLDIQIRDQDLTVANLTSIRSITDMLNTGYGMAPVEEKQGVASGQIK
ncbi:phosphopantetheine-binding protein [Paenibacillus sp. WLX2291]|uniref:phosphopantetheine-binding protein n=1 Tax=Paenibacillus sp. WLX2291 TaxID=3296934 RepID=UPI003983F879